MKNQISEIQMMAIEAILTNDESSTDQELIVHFITEIGLDEQTASEWVAKRDHYMGKI